MVKYRPPSQAVIEARARREARAIEKAVEIEWFIKEVSNTVRLTVKQRVKLATDFVKNRVVQNISRPVTVGVSAKGNRVVTDRSKPGEYPKADTTQLMKTIFGEVGEEGTGDWNGYVGTPLDYGIFLELVLDRKFLSRTLYEEYDKVIRLLTGPIR